MKCSKMKNLLLISLSMLINSAYSAPTSSIPYEDREEIMNVLALFPHAYDGRDAERFLDLYVPEAKIAMYRAGKLMQESIPLPSAGTLKSTFSFQEKNGEFISRHYLSNILLEKMADGNIAARSSFTLISQKTDSSIPKLLGTGEFMDIFIKTPSGWKYLRHEIHIDQGFSNQQK